MHKFDAYKVFFALVALERAVSRKMARKVNRTEFRPKPVNEGLHSA